MITAIGVTAEVGFLSRPVIRGNFPVCVCLGAIWPAERAVPLHFLRGRPSGKPSIWRGRNNGLVVCPPAELESRPFISSSPNVRSGRAGLLVALLASGEISFTFRWSREYCCLVSHRKWFSCWEAELMETRFHMLSGKRWNVVLLHIFSIRNIPVSPFSRNCLQQVWKTVIS